MTLYQRFFEAAKIDMAAAKILTEKDLCQPALYHLQQAYEKCVKAYFILKDINIKKSSESTVYSNITKLSHDTEKSTITLLKDMADLEKQAYETKLPSISDQQVKNAFQKVMTALDNYESSLDKLEDSQGLDTNYVRNVLNYSHYVTSRYELHLNFVNMVISKQPRYNFPVHPFLYGKPLSIIL